MSKSMINIKAVKPSSETHNLRRRKYKHVYPELSQNNEHWVGQTISSMKKEVAAYCKTKSGRKMQKNATPIREAVVLIKPDTSLADLQSLAKELEDKFKIQCFQIHTHKDEGVSEDNLNLHAHMVFRWQDMETGKTLRLNKVQMAQMQTLVAEALGMERGQRKTNDVERLEPIEYKRKQEEIRLKELQEQYDFVEQKKNEVRARIKALTSEGGEPEEWVIRILTRERRSAADIGKLQSLTDEQLNQAIAWVRKRIDSASEKRS